MDWQYIANAAFTIAGILLGIVINSTRDSIKELHKVDSELTDKVQRIEVLVAGDYVKRNDLDTIAREIFNKLNKISDKLDGKADK